MTLLSRFVMALVLLLAATAAHAQPDPANNIVCPSELTYQDCVDAGYLNHIGNGRGGGGGGGGYCQDMASSGGSLTTYCNGNTSQCPFSFCQNAPMSGEYCVTNSRYTCCDGTTGSQAVLETCY